MVAIGGDSDPFNTYPVAGYLVHAAPPRCGVEGARSTSNEWGFAVTPCELGGKSRVGPMIARESERADGRGRQGLAVVVRGRGPSLGESSWEAKLSRVLRSCPRVRLER